MLQITAAEHLVYCVFIGRQPLRFFDLFPCFFAVFKKRRHVAPQLLHTEKDISVAGKDLAIALQDHIVKTPYLFFLRPLS